jgi:PAS domain S-box-containing protein
MGVGLGVAYLLQIPQERDWPGEPFLLFLLVVIGTTLCFGTRLGLISAALSVFLSLYFFEPVGSPTVHYASDQEKILLYATIVFGCVGAILFAEVRTEQLEARRALAESEARFRAAFENAAVGVVLVDPNGSLLRVNDTFASMLGYSAKELETKTFQDITHLDDLAANLSLLKKTLTGEANSYCIEKRYVRKDGRLIWANLTVGCVRKLDGAVDYFLSVLEDITDRKLVEARLAERNAQLDAAGKIARMGTFVYDHGTRILQLSPGCAAVYGLPEGLEISREDWRARLHPDDLPQLDAIVRRAFANGDREFVPEFRIIRDGQVRWIESRVLISYNETGKPVRRVGAMLDVTERKQAHQALTDRNKQLELAAKFALVGRYAIEIDPTREDFTSHRLHFSPGFAAIYGLPEETSEISVGDWRSLVHPDDLPQFVEHRQQLLAERRGEHHAEHRIVRPCGTIRWIEARAFIEYDQAGRPERMVGVNIDITDRKRAEEARKILNAELDHRVKNALSTVSAVVSHTQQGSGSIADFVAALDGRIRSMATTHELLSSHEWHGVSLMQLVRRELAPYDTRNNTEIDGPSVFLKAEAGQAMAMVLHELATNAAKYGALSSKNGRVSIRWHRHLNGHPQSHLVFEWQEIDGPPVIAVGKPSYGTSTIRDLIPYEFGGTVDLVFAPEGARCRLEFPSGWFVSDLPFSETRARASPRTGEASV